jgi:hypothetical protein
VLDVDDSIRVADPEQLLSGLGLGPGPLAARPGTGMRARVGEQGTRGGHHLGRVQQLKKAAPSRSW